MKGVGLLPTLAHFSQEAESTTHCLTFLKQVYSTPSGLGSRRMVGMPNRG